MESSLIFKTFVILGSQLFLVFAICLFVINARDLRLKQAQVYLA